MCEFVDWMKTRERVTTFEQCRNLMVSKYEHLIQQCQTTADEFLRQMKPGAGFELHDCPACQLAIARRRALDLVCQHCPLPGITEFRCLRARSFAPLKRLERKQETDMSLWISALNARLAFWVNYTKESK